MNCTEKENIKGETHTHQQEGDLVRLIHLNDHEKGMQTDGQTQTDTQTNSKVVL
jgi:hypothetical protein